MTKKKQARILAGPYLLWCVAFTLIPLLMIFYYGFTTAKGVFTFQNLALMAKPENLKALGLALLLSLISTVLCLLLAYPLAMILPSLDPSPPPSLPWFLFPLHSVNMCQELS